MKLIVDTNENSLISIDEQGEEARMPFYSQEGFAILSKAWIKQQWNQLHWQSFSWFGLPIWQFPEDLIRLQEVLVALKPDVIVETGINQGGSALFFASICRLLGRGRVISIDISIPMSVSKAITESPFADLITLIEGDSASSEIVDQVKRLVGAANSVLVFLDSDHSQRHVRKELEAYADLVTPGSYIVATDGVMRDLADTPNGHKSWQRDNPAAAVGEFVAEHPEFSIKTPNPLFGQQYRIEQLTYWPDAWLLRER